MLNFLRNHQTLSYKWSHHFIFLPTEYNDSVSPHSHQQLLLPVLFCVFESRHSNKWKCYLTVVLICISLVACDVEHLLHVYWPFVHHEKLWIRRNTSWNQDCWEKYHNLRYADDTTLMA